MNRRRRPSERKGVTFTRTPSGINNYGLFFKKTKLIFVEGAAGRSQSESDDVYFWALQASFFLPNVKFKIKACGSKNNLIKIYRAILASKHDKTLFVAMDRDYDCFSADYKEDNNVLVTYGYSYENDLIRLDVFKSFITSYCRDISNSNHICREIDFLIDEFRRKIRWILYADILLHGSGLNIIDKSKLSGRFIDVSPKTKNISFCNKFAFHQMQKRKEVLRKLINVKPDIDAMRFMKGKIVIYFLCSISIYILKKYTRKSTADLDEKIKICFFDQMKNRHPSFLNDVFNHYEQQFSKIKQSYEQKVS